MPNRFFNPKETGDGWRIFFATRPLESGNPTNNMKITVHNKSAHSENSGSGQRPGGIRPTIARALERRYERRKIREQLRRLDWALNTEEEFTG